MKHEKIRTRRWLTSAIEQSRIAAKSPSWGRPARAVIRRGAAARARSA